MHIVIGMLLSKVTFSQFLVNFHIFKDALMLKQCYHLELKLHHMLTSNIFYIVTPASNNFKCLFLTKVHLMHVSVATHVRMLLSELL